MSDPFRMPNECNQLNFAAGATEISNILCRSFFFFFNCICILCSFKCFCQIIQPVRTGELKISCMCLFDAHKSKEEFYKNFIPYSCCSLQH